VSGASGFSLHEYSMEKLSFGRSWTTYDESLSKIVAKITYIVIAGAGHLYEQ
jgi:hypothetical protein